MVYHFQSFCVKMVGKLCGAGLCHGLAHTAYPEVPVTNREYYGTAPGISGKGPDISAPVCGEIMRNAAYLMNLFFVFLFVGTLPLAGVSAAALQLASPDGAVQIVFRLAAKQAPTYSVAFRRKPVVENSPLSLEFRHGGTWG